ncbi:3-deoxy-D-manno-octulosonic acid transferase [Gemmobacter caeruleus]|uniref:3-deoxy-D-manno-octulosonic acid transferase n=1 Tax=Gemmobacter caeruleus TaxID=2595004 RepID=UPI0011ECDF60|nr:glycosyltransferase N-terminal domain-containing protein [Gemmobacter caeruleus]
MGLYRLLLRLLMPVLILHVLGQRLRGRVGAGALRERLALGAAEGADLWLHGASNGELTSVRWLLERLLAETPGLRIIVTCNSWTARAMVAGWGLPGLRVRLAPFDSPSAVRRFIAAWRPHALILIESELWPERIARMAERGPVIALGARMSEGSARNWRRVAGGLAAAMLGRIALLSAQDAGSETRFRALGLPQDRIAPRLMLKARATGQAATLPFAPPAARARLLLAASTHAGEEAVILTGFAQAREVFDLLILAPRHPRRSAEVADAIRASGLSHATRSAGEVPGPGTAVYLADTLGEMDAWYAMAGATVIGGTFGDAGGHTPYEPAAHGSAILHGPGTANFREVFARLDAAGAALAVTAETLGPALRGLTPARQAALAAAAPAVLAPADEAALLAALRPLLPQPSE